MPLPGPGWCRACLPSPLQSRGAASVFVCSPDNKTLSDQFTTVFWPASRFCVTHVVTVKGGKDEERGYINV